MPYRSLTVAALCGVLLMPLRGGTEEQKGTGQGFLGINMATALDDSGVVVLEVVPNSPADQVGLMTGDVIARVDDKVTKDQDILASIIRLYKPGTKVTLGVLRNGKEEKIEVTLGERPPNT